MAYPKEDPEKRELVRLLGRKLGLAEDDITVENVKAIDARLDPVVVADNDPTDPAKIMDWDVRDPVQIMKML